MEQELVRILEAVEADVRTLEVEVQQSPGGLVSDRNMPPAESFVPAGSRDLQPFDWNAWGRANKVGPSDYSQPVDVTGNPD